MTAAEKQNEQTGKPENKNKFVITDKMIYIAVTAAFCIFLMFLFLAPKIVNYAITKSIRTAMDGSDNVDNFVENTGTSIGKANKALQANLVENAEEAVISLKGHEQEMLALLPENIKNMNFSDGKAKAEFFSMLAKSGTGNTGDLEKISQQQLSQQQLSQEQFAAIQSLSVLYGAQEYIR